MATLGLHHAYPFIRMTGAHLNSDSFSFFGFFLVCFSRAVTSLGEDGDILNKRPQKEWDFRGMLLHPSFGRSSLQNLSDWYSLPVL